jgi:hypothetical protein
VLNRTYWIIPGRIISNELSGTVSLQDVKSLIAGMKTLTDSHQQSSYVDALLDLSRVSRYDSDVMNIKKLFSAVKKNERVRWNIIVNPDPNPVLDFVVRTVCQLFGTRIRIVRTLDEALIFVQTESAQNPVH